MGGGSGLDRGRLEDRKDARRCLGFNCVILELSDLWTLPMTWPHEITEKYGSGVLIYKSIR